VISSATLEKGMRVVIGPCGLESPLVSQREGGQSDGITYFGRKKSVKKDANDPSQIESNTTVIIILNL
jgi:hypothetical protein